MAGNIDDPSKWRLVTSSGVRYKILECSGEFEPVTANVKLSIAIPSNKIFDLMRELFPPNILINGLYIPQWSTFGNTNLRPQKVSFKSWETGIPADPFLLDQNAPENTYCKALRCDIDYAPPTFSDPKGDPTDPKTFLEIKAGVTSEYIHTAPKSIEWQDMNEKNQYVGKPVTNRAAVIPATILVPQTTWNVKWNSIPFSFFFLKLRPILRAMMGKVNSSLFDLLYIVDPKTLLFVGYDYDYNFTWNDNLNDTPLISLTMKFAEKNIAWANATLWPDGSPKRKDDQLNTDGTLKTPGTGDIVYGKVLPRGHCDFWRPGTGWQRMLINGRESYDAYDFNTMFNLGTPAAPGT